MSSLSSQRGSGRFRRACLLRMVAACPTLYVTRLCANYYKSFPGHLAFTPSNSANRRRSSKYATSERAAREEEYAPSEQGRRARGQGAARTASERYVRSPTTGRRAAGRVTASRRLGLARARRLARSALLTEVPERVARHYFRPAGRRGA
jgi:hypothetical protein